MERHLAGILMALADDLRALPDHPILSVDYQQARSMLHDHINLAMKHSMRAGTYTQRASEPEKFEVVGCRRDAAESWWGFRRAVRKAIMYHGFARVFLELDQEIGS